MTRYVFSDVSLEWLKDKMFNDNEIEQLQEVLNGIDSKKEQRIRLPKDASSKVSAMAYLLDSITDADGRPICFEDSGLIDIPEEARKYFGDDLELDELDKVVGKLKKVKFARRYSDPRRRGTMKGNEKSSPE